MSKRFVFDHAARSALQRGLDQLAQTVRVTLGPSGRGVVLDALGGVPSLTHDGMTIAREIQLADPFENMGVQLGAEASRKTQDVVGDGTTTATVLAQALVAAGLRAVESGVRPLALKRGLDQATQAVVEALRGEAREIDAARQLERVIRLATKSDPELSQLIAEALLHLGEHGVVLVEASRAPGDRLEVHEGVRFPRGYVSPYFVTDPERMAVDLDQAYLLVHDRPIESLEPLVPLLEEVARSGRGLLLVAEDIGGEALSALVVNRLRGTLDVVAVRAPDYGERRRDVLDDLALLTGGVVVSEEGGRTLDSSRIEDLGRAERVVVERESTTIVGGAGQGAAMTARIRDLRRRVRTTDSQYEKDRLEDRLRRLGAGVVVAHVGGRTPIEQRHRQARAEDGVSSARAALEEGVVVGGGAALVRARQAVDALGLEGDAWVGGEVLKEALGAPLRQIVANAGLEAGVILEQIAASADPTLGFNAETLQVENLEVSGILDPVKVVRVALCNAVSIAGMILTTESLVADDPSDPPPPPELED